MEGKNDLKKTHGIKTRYKQYPNAEASFVDFCRLMTNKKFYKKLKGNMNHRPWIDAISNAGYSEVPEMWKERVTTTIRKHKLSRYQLVHPPWPPIESCFFLLFPVS